MTIQRHKLTICVNGAMFVLAGIGGYVIGWSASTTQSIKLWVCCDGRFQPRPYDAQNYDAQNYRDAPLESQVAARSDRLAARGSRRVRDADRG